MPPETTFADLYQSVNLSCAVTGSPQPTIEWFKDGQTVSGEVQQFLFISQLDVVDRGEYYCTATNEVGSFSSASVFVNINGE